MKYLIVGLGNIGVEYENTRHNIGFMAVDHLAAKQGVSFTSGRYGSTASFRLRGHEFTLLKPSTYMNLSGKAVRYWVNELKIDLSQLVVICDDLNLPFGTLRLKKQGSSGGHNGLKNIAELLGGESWARIRFGIGNDFAKGQQIDFVLEKFTPEELAATSEILDRLCTGIMAFAFEGADRAMTKLNIRPKNEQKSE